MASSYLLLRLAADEIFQTLQTSSSSSCYDAFVPVFRPDPSASSASSSSAAAADRVRSQFLSVEPDLFHDALVAPRNDRLGFLEEDEEEQEASIRWDCFQLDDEEEPDLPLEASTAAEEFDWEEVASASGAGVEAPEPEWEVLGDVPPPAPADADEGFVYTSDREAYEVLVAGGEGLFLTSKPPAARSAVEALPSAIVAAGEEGEGEDCAVCRDGVAAGERVKRLPCSHRYHEECIVPWFEVRNSCPLCRFELPTDDPKYETWKAERAAAAVVEKVKSVLGWTEAGDDVILEGMFEAGVGSRTYPKMLHIKSELEYKEVVAGSQVNSLELVAIKVSGFFQAELHVNLNKTLSIVAYISNTVEVSSMIIWKSWM